PPFQHRGYGAACVRECIERMDALGLELSVLWTQVATFPFYELNGYQAVERYGGTYSLTRSDAAGFRGSATRVSTLADEPGRLPEAVSLHASAGPGITRSPDEARALFFLPKMTTWVALDGDRVVAYL